MCEIIYIIISIYVIGISFVVFYAMYRLYKLIKECYELIGGNVDLIEKLTDGTYKHLNNLMDAFSKHLKVTHGFNVNDKNEKETGDEC